MKGLLTFLVICMMLTGNALAEEVAFTPGTTYDQGFLMDNALTTADGTMHFNLYVPDAYDGSEPYALYIALPGWEGLYFQGLGADMAWEKYVFEAQKYNDRMIVASAQLNDWGVTSARHTIALTEYLLSTYNIDPEKVYLSGLSGGGETGSLVMGLRPNLYAAYLMIASQWDGDLKTLAAARTPVYMAIGEDDSYYGSGSLKRAYAELTRIYESEGLDQREIARLVTLDVKDEEYFTRRGYSDQHAGSVSFAYETNIMEWLFGEH